MAATDHRRFWDAMDALDTAKLAAAEAAISTAMVTEFGLDLSGLALDMTNFATFIDSTNDRAPIAKRGHAKQKRYDLRLVGLALVVTRDGAIPLTSHAYPGNRPDVTQFSTVRTAHLPLPRPVRQPPRRWDRADADGGVRRRTEQRRRATHTSAESACTSSAPCHPATSLTCSPYPPAAANRSIPRSTPA